MCLSSLAKDEWEWYIKMNVYEYHIKLSYFSNCASNAAITFSFAN